MEFLPIVLIIIFSVVVFVFIRELVCWYFKINEKLEVMKSIDNKLSYLMPESYKEPKEEKPVMKKYDAEYWKNYNEEK